MLFYLLSALGLLPTFQKTKCKRLLNLTLERIKLLEKRRLARLRQLHKDVIELSQLNKRDKLDPLLLRISKEQCLGAVYVTTAQYCEIVQSNLKDIAGQMACPESLKEPVAGLCFAASCCADLPELQELREIFAMKYDKEIVSSGQDLKPNCNFLDKLYAKDPSEQEKQELLSEIRAQYHVMLGHKQVMQQQEIHDSVSSTDSSVNAKESQEKMDYTIRESEVEDRSECEASQQVDVVHEAKHTETVCNEDLGSSELANELANRKRTLEDRETRRSAFKRAQMRRKFWQNKAMEGEANGGKEHEQTAVKAQCYGAEVNGDTRRNLISVHHDGYRGCAVLQGEHISAHMNKDVVPNRDLRILRYVNQPPCSQPPQHPPPPPPTPPKQAPSMAPSLRVISMPSSHDGKQVNANTSLPLRCSTMANNYYLETSGSHVHPRLPSYDDLVANFTALKRNIPYPVIST